MKKEERNDDIVRIAQYDDGQGLSVQQSIITANQRKIGLLSNLKLDNRLVGSDEWKQEKEMYPAWSGTFIAYESPGMAFGKTVAFRDLIVNVPKQFQGRVDCVLVCNHPDFTLKNNIVSLGKSARCLSFPKSDGWYLPDENFGIPCGEKSNSLNSNARYLYRRDNSNYVGLVARGDDFIYYGRLVCCDYYYYGRFGVFGSSVGATKKNVKCHHEWVCKHCGERRKS